MKRFSENFDHEAVTYLRRGSGNFFLNYIFEISPTKKMRYVTASWSKFSLNLFTEEVWYGLGEFQSNYVSAENSQPKSELILNPKSVF